MSLGLRLALIVLLAAAPIFAYEIDAEFRRREERRDEAIHEVERLASLIAANESRFVDAANYLLSAVAKLESVQNRDSERCTAQLEAIRLQFSDVAGLAAVGRDGRTFCSSTPGGPMVDISDRPYFQAALRNKSLTSSGYIVGRQTGAGSFVLVLPVLDEDGEVTAMTFVAFRTASLSKALREVSLPPAAVVTLIDANGIVVARSADEERWVGVDLAEGPFVEPPLAIGGGVAEGTGLDGVDRFYGFARVRPPADLLVTVGLPHNSIFAEADRALQREIAFLIAFSLIVAGLAFAYAEYGVRRPIRALETAVGRFVRGDAERVEPVGAAIPEVVRLSRHLGAMSSELQSREASLRKAIAERDVLLREVNHRVKNSLQMISSLFDLHRIELKDPEARRQFGEASRRVSTVARVHQRLYQGPDVERIEFGQYLRDLCADLAISLARNSEQRLVCEADECYLSTDQVVPMALVLNELITNAFKYGIGDRPGRVAVTCRQTPDGGLRIVVQDDGPGMPANGEALNGGLGLRLVHGLAEQINAKVDVESTDGGTVFSIAIARLETPADAEGQG